MKVENGNPISYSLTLENQEIFLNDFIGKEINLKFLNEKIEKNTQSENL